MLAPRPLLTLLRRLPPIPLYLSKVQAGFPSPASDYQEADLDLHQLLIQHPACTYFVRADSHVMSNAGIFLGDILIIDRSITARVGKVVIAIVKGEFLLRRLVKQAGRMLLISESHPDTCQLSTDITHDAHAEIWGVVTTSIHTVK